MNLATHPLPTTEVRMARKKPGKAKKPKPPKQAGRSAKPRNEPAQWQERHSPTVPVIIGVNGRRTDSGARRRKLDAEFFMDLDNAQTQAAEELRDAYAASFPQTPVKGMRYDERVDNEGFGVGVDLAESDWSTHYLAWAKLCAVQPKPVDIHAVQQVIVFGYACRVVDVARGRASYKGLWASGHVKRGLDLWSEARPKRRRIAA